MYKIPPAANSLKAVNKIFKEFYKNILNQIKMTRGAVTLFHSGSAECFRK